MSSSKSQPGKDTYLIGGGRTVATLRLTISAHQLYHGTWLSHTVTEQLGWLVSQGQVGAAIWDASLMAPEWRQAGVWNQLKTIRAR